jgi:ABC-2 type transport system permease protein
MFSSSLLSELLVMKGFAYRNWIIIRRNVFTIFEIIFWPLFGLIAVGLLGSFLRLSGEEISFILIGAICFSCLHVCQIDVAYVLLFDLWGKSIKHTFLSPIKSYHFIAGSLLVGILRSILVFLLLVLFGAYAFGFDLLSPGIFPLLHFLIGIFMNAALIGILVCVLLLTFGYRAEVAAWSLTGIIMLVCGFYYPASILPEPFFILSRAIPVTYFLEYFRSFYLPPSFPPSLTLGYSLSLLYLLAGFLLLKFTIHRARKTGLLLRLSE